MLTGIKEYKKENKEIVKFDKWAVRNSIAYDRVENMVWINRNDYNKKFIDFMKTLKHNYYFFNSCGELLYIEF